MKAVKPNIKNLLSYLDKIPYKYNFQTIDFQTSANIFQKSIKLPTFAFSINNKDENVLYFAYIKSEGLFFPNNDKTFFTTHRKTFVSFS